MGNNADKNNLEDLNNLITEKDNQIDILKQELANEKLINNKTKDYLLILESKVVEFDKQKEIINSLNLQTSQLNEEISTKDSEIKSLKQELETSNEISLLKSDLINIKEINNKTKDYLLLEIESSWDRYFQKQGNENKNLEKVIQFLKEDNSNRVNEISSLNRKLGEYEECLINKNMLIESLESKNEDLIRDISSYKHDVDSLQNELKLTNNKFHEELSKVNSLKEEINHLDSTISDKDDSINKLTAELEKNEMDLEDKTNSILTLDKALNDISEKVGAMDIELINKDNEIDFLNNQIEDYCLEIDNKNNVIEECNNNVSDLLSEKNQLKSIIHEKENQMNIFKEKIGEYTKINEKLNLKINEIRSDDEKIIDGLNDEINRIRCEDGKIIDGLNDEIDRIRSDDEKIIGALNDEIDWIRSDDEKIIGALNDEKINNHLEINYLKNFSLIKKVLNPFAYVYLVLKSNPKEISLNFKLYRALKNSKCFDIGYYLNNNEDIRESRWCKYFSPELHYVCKGFNEKRKFNKKHFNGLSKNDFLNYIESHN